MGPSGQLPDLTSLRCFLLAAKHLNFRAAAEEAALVPTAFGHRIRQLEHDVGASLFIRTTRSVQLTRAGVDLLPHAEACLAAARACRTSAQPGQSRAHFALTVGTRQELGLSWLYPAVASMRKTHPWLELHLFFGAGPDLLTHVRSGRIDCAISSSRLADTQLSAIGLHPESYTFCASPKLLKRKPLQNIRDAESHTLIDVGPDLPLFRYWRDAPKSWGELRFERVLNYGTIAAVSQALHEEVGVAVLPTYFIRKELSRRKLIPIAPKVNPLDDSFRLVHRSSDVRTEVFAELARVLRKRPLT
jgi:LysR family glycine cleavage system transcriptional activator